MKATNKMFKFLGGLFIAAIMLTSMPLAGVAHAAAVTINVTGITNHSAAILPVGAYVQIIRSADGSAGAPDSNGLPTGDTVVGTGTINPAGQFSGAASITSNNYVYIRVWETWNGSGSPAAGTYYGTGAVENVGSGFVYTYDPAGFSTNQQTSVPSAGTLQFSAATYSVAENGTSVTINVTRTGGSSGAASINYATSDGSATAGSDYTAASGTLNWASGDAANKTFVVNITNDTADESDETVNLTLSGASGASLGSPSTATLTINDDDGIPAPTITRIELTSAPGTPITNANIGDGISIVGTNLGATQGTSTITINGTPVTTVYYWAPDGTKVDFAVPAGATSGNVVITVGGVPSAGYPLTIGGTGPDITGIDPSSPEAGQTIVITGTNLGTSGTITVGGVTVTPTRWTSTEIVTTIPTGVPTGDATLVVTTPDGSDSITINIGGGDTIGTIYIDDFEGGCVGNFTAPATESGYYAFDNGVTPDNLTINADLRQADAAHDGSLGAKVRYSYVSGYGGGWGAKLVSTRDLTSANYISFYVNWDGSTNALRISLKDSDGTAFAADVANSTLNLTGWHQVILAKTDFTHDADGSDSGANSTFNWAAVAGYNIVYNTNGTSTNYHSIDSIIASEKDPGGEITGEVVITSVTPPSGPAGTRITVNGLGFGDTQGQSRLVFENTTTHLTYAVDIIAWGNTTIEAEVPRLAPSGNYTLKAIKVTIVADVMRAYESNPAAFQVTSSTPAPGIATIFPNPFNPLMTGLNASGTPSNEVAIAFNAASTTNVSIYIYDLTGRLVYHEVMTGNQVSWDGKDTQGNLVGDGVYLLRVVNEDGKGLIAKGKILVVKRK